MSTRAPLIRNVAVATALVATLAACGSGSSTEPPPSAARVSPQPRASSIAPASATPESSVPASFVLPQGADVVELDPALFVGVPLDHPFWPMAAGNRWTYRETDAEGTEQGVEVVVTGDTKEILGIPATVVHDTVTSGDQLVEDTIDWYAQDRLGNLWYLGEDTKEYEGGTVVSTEGSWEAGVNGAQAGIILPADPQAGMAYRQEYLAGQAEDAAEIIAVDAQVDVPYGSFHDVLETRDFTPLDAAVEEHKFYARGIGPVEVRQSKGGSSHEILLTFTPG